MKLELPTVTLVCIDCRPPQPAIDVLEHCQKLCNFGAVRFFTSREIDYPHTTIEEIADPRGLEHYSRWILTQVHKYIETTHMLIVQHDGWIIHPEKWRPDWLQYDYIGPLFALQDVVGQGCVTLRTKRLMALTAEMIPADPETYLQSRYLYEDGVISISHRRRLESQGCRFPDLQTAAQFGFGGNMTHFCGEPFAFHRLSALDTLLGGAGKHVHRKPDGTIVGQ